MTNTDRYNYAFDPDGDAWAARILRRLPLGADVLELGPGPGAMTRVMLANGHRVVAIENDVDALAALSELNVEVVNANLDANDWIGQFRERQFDAILACDVLEHLRDPEAVLRSLRLAVGSNGRLIVSVPNIAYAGVLSALRGGNFNYADKGQLDRTHIRFFTRKSFESLLLQTGWIPQTWEANRVAIDDSEFSGDWAQLSDSVRESLSDGWNDFNVYQWMVEAVPANENGWQLMWSQELTQARREIEVVRIELKNLMETYQQEHESLLEHQKAFGEAKSIIGDLQQQLIDVSAAYQCEINKPSLRHRFVKWIKNKLFHDVRAGTRDS